MKDLINKRFIALIVSMVITRFFVSSSSLIIISEGKHKSDAFIAVFCFLGVYCAVRKVITFFLPENESPS